MTFVPDQYPEVEPHDHGLLDTGEGHLIYWEVSGNPAGKPAVVLHGGPGAGCSPRHRRLFDPGRYRIVLFDQRGCGRSSPLGEVTNNTTWHLLADLERLREHLGIGRWLVLGSSWGSALALAYTQHHPERVTGLILCGVFTVRYKELAWFYGGGAGALFPEQWQHFLAPLPDGQRDGDLIEAYHRLLHDPDPAVHEPASVAWSSWEVAAVTLRPRPELIEQAADPARAVPFARIGNHYYRHAGWLEEGSLLQGTDMLAGIPGIMIQGRYDVVTPATTAWELSRAWPDAELVIVDDAGHSPLDPGILRQLIRATDRFASGRSGPAPADR